MGRFRNRHYTRVENSRVKIVAFHTPSYSIIVKELEKSIQRFGYDYEIVEVEDRGTWEENCGQKPKVIYDALVKYEDDILYLDADAVITRELPLEDLTGDVMRFYIMEWTPPETGKKIYELLSGTLFLPYNEVTLDIVKKWITHQQNNPMLWDQKTLSEVLNKMPDYKYVPFSAEWTYIKDYHSKFDLDPIVIHGQASREMK